MKTTHRTRMPTTLEAFSPIIVMLLLLGLGYALFDLPAEPLMIISTVFAGFLVIIFQDERYYFGRNSVKWERNAGSAFA